MFITVCVGGVFVIENKKIVDYRLFEKSPQVIAKKLKMFENGEIFEELEILHKKYNAPYKQPNPASEYLRENMRKILIDVNFVKDDKELNKLLSEVSAQLTRTKISKLERRDKLIIQAVSALNDFDKILNTMSERLREWYRLHYPELDIENHEKFAEIIMKFGKRENIENFSESMGMDLKEEDIEILKNFAAKFKEGFEFRKKLEKYLEKIVPEEMPNMCVLLGPMLAARMLALAGSLEKLAKLPSSTIQLLGSEKSLFRYLKGEQAKVPRFGILYTHPDVSGAKRDLQAKVARLLSSKLTLAVRADFYSKNDMSKELVEDYRAKLKEIR